MPETVPRASDVLARPMQPADEAAADRVVRLAFGTFLGLPRPEEFMGDTGYIAFRRRASPESAFVAERAGEIVGSNFATSWGSVGFFGPLSVRPDLWDAGVGRRLMAPVMDCFDRWQTRHAGLFTFAQSSKHVGLYRSFGFWPRFLTFVMARPVGAAGAPPPQTFGTLDAAGRDSALRAARELTGSILEGLDASSEIRALHEQRLGDTVLLGGEAGLHGLAVCHTGPGSEAGSGTCYVKFGAVRCGPRAERDFARLLQACEAFAASRGLSKLTAGVNAARVEACQALFASGFRTELQGVAMQRPNDPGYNRPGVFLIDDWR